MTALFPVSTSVMQSRLRPQIRALQPELVEWRRYLHQRPELGFHERLTSEFIATQLRTWGIPHQTGIAKTGIVATIVGERPGPVLGIRADMDALPILEENQVPYKSLHEGKMHACGHDGHTAIALGTAYYLWQHRDFAGTVKVIFQPAEEGAWPAPIWGKVPAIPYTEEQIHHIHHKLAFLMDAEIEFAPES